MRRGARRAAAVLVAALVLGACSDGITQPDLVIDVDLESVYKVLHQVGDQEQFLYGWNNLKGTSAGPSGERLVELQATVNYVNGSGPCTGQITVTDPDGSVLAAALENCRASAQSATSGARFASDIRVLGGTGSYLYTRGTGVFVGERMEAIGGLVRSRFSFRLHGAAD
jgi:hypothetical protein